MVGFCSVLPARRSEQFLLRVGAIAICEILHWLDEAKPNDQSCNRRNDSNSPDYF